MDQQKDNTLALVIVLLILAIVIAGGIYLWQSSEPNETDIVVPVEDVTDEINLNDSGTPEGS